MELNDVCRFWTMNLEFIRSLVDSTFYVLACCIAHDTPGRRTMAEGQIRFGVIMVLRGKITAYVRIWDFAGCGWFERLTGYVTR